MQKSHLLRQKPYNLQVHLPKMSLLFSESVTVLHSLLLYITYAYLSARNGTVGTSVPCSIR